MVLAAAGGVDHDKLVDLAKQFFGTSVAQDQSTVETVFSPCVYTGSDVSSIYKVIQILDFYWQTELSARKCPYKHVIIKILQKKHLLSGN